MADDAEQLGALDQDQSGEQEVAYRTQWEPFDRQAVARILEAYPGCAGAEAIVLDALAHARLTSAIDAHALGVKSEREECLKIARSMGSPDDGRTLGPFGRDGDLCAESIAREIGARR